MYIIIFYPPALMTELHTLGINNVRVTAVHPYVTDTGMFNNAKSKFPLIFPILKSDWVADEIIKATKEERFQVGGMGWELGFRDFVLECMIV